jgi:hypothetical protein
MLSGMNVREQARARAYELEEKPLNGEWVVGVASRRG